MKLHAFSLVGIDCRTLDRKDALHANCEVPASWNGLCRPSKRYLHACLLFLPRGACPWLHSRGQGEIKHSGRHRPGNIGDLEEEGVESRSPRHRGRFSKARIPGPRGHGAHLCGGPRFPRRRGQGQAGQTGRPVARRRTSRSSPSRSLGPHFLHPQPGQPERHA